MHRGGASVAAVTAVLFVLNMAVIAEQGNAKREVKAKEDGGDGFLKMAVDPDSTRTTAGKPQKQHPRQRREAKCDAKQQKAEGGYVKRVGENVFETQNDQLLSFYSRIRRDSWIFFHYTGKRKKMHCKITGNKGKYCTKWKEKQKNPLKFIKNIYFAMNYLHIRMAGETVRGQEAEKAGKRSGGALQRRRAPKKCT